MAKNNLDTIDKIQVVKNNLVCDYGFFGQLLLSCTFKEMEKEDMLFPTMCTDGKDIFFSSEFIDSLTVNELGFLIMHEVMHCALGHLWRRETRDAVVWNLATDYAINIMLKNISEAYFKKNIGKIGGKKFKDLAFELVVPKNILLEESFADKTAEEIYNILMENSDKSKDGTGKIKIIGNNGASAGGGNCESSLSKNNDDTYSGVIYEPTNHDMWKQSDNMDDNLKRKMTKKWEEKLIAASETLKEAGITAGGIEMIVHNIKCPQKNWRILLYDFIQEETHDYSWCPPDKRYDGDFMLCDYNDTVESVQDILFFVDTSGSMSTKDLNLCFSEIQGAINQFNNHLKGTLLFFDTEVKSNYYRFEDVNDDISGLTAFGGGGTSYKCVFDFLDNNTDFDSINGVVILTDGFCEYPENPPPYPVLWIYTNEKNHHKPPYGLSTSLNPSFA